MSDDHLDPPRRTAAEERADRLAAELRANLQRRKAQIRGRAAAGDTPAPMAAPSADHD